MSTTAYLPITGEEIDDFIRGLLDRLIDALSQAEFSPQPAVVVGTQLVARGFASGQSLGRTIEILGHALPALDELRTVEGLAGKVVSLLAALATGYGTALRRRALDQQDDVKRALLRVTQNAERERRISAAQFREVFDSAPMGIAVSRLDGTITESNGSLTEILHYPPDKLAGRDVRELFHPDDAMKLCAAYQRVREGQVARFQSKVRLVAANGDTTWVSLAVAALRDAAGSPTDHVTMVEDFTDVHLLEEHLRHQTLHDLLTGLPNRQYFAIHLDGVLERAKPGAIIMLYKIDLDCFAVVNDGLGQGFGDLLLRSVARRLHSLVAGEQAMVARFGADEFAILIEESPTTPNAGTLAARINAELSEPVNLGGRDLAVSACVGIVRRPAQGAGTAELIRAAEATLHQAQRTGLGQWGLYDPPADADQRARYALAAAMPEAWESGQVTLQYQPLVRLDSAATDTSRMVALAALLRWDHPEAGVVAHEDCIALAEQTGLVLSIGRWMLRQACEQLRSWRDQLGDAVPPVRVDLTTYLTQDPDLVAVVRDALTASQLRPADIQLGMPVEVIVAGHGDSVDNVGTLADIGVRTVLTRYGQAVGNLVLLESLPVHGVELAGRLVRMAAEPGSVVRSALVSLVPLIRRTGAAVVVAGIDDAEQADWWRHTGAACARGTALTPPMAPQAVPALLRQNRS